MSEATDTLPPLPSDGQIMDIVKEVMGDDYRPSREQYLALVRLVIQQERERVTKLAEHYAQGMRALGNETAAEAAMACSRLAASGYPGAAAIRSQE